MRVLKAIAVIALTLLPLAAQAQAPACSGNGALDASGQCACFAGFAGPQCQYSRFTTCSAHGTPTASGSCTCDTGFAGSACQTCDVNYYGPSCRFCTAATTCGGHGSCNTSGFCVCESNYTGSNCQACGVNYYSYPVCTYCNASVTCNGRGFCDSNGSCACAAGFTGAGCDIPTGPAITCLNPTLVVPATANTCSAFPTAAEIFSVQDPTAQCAIDPAGPYTVGTNSVRVSCTTPTGGSSAQCSMTVVESLPQVACPDVTVACTGGLPQQPQGSSVCSPVNTQCTLSTGAPWITGSSLGGATTYTCNAATPGGAAGVCTGKLVATEVGPVVELYPGPTNMWPPNNKMQAFELSDCISSAVDACTGQPIDIDTRARVVSVTSDECADPRIDSLTTVQLRRQRDGGGNGRVYTIHFEVANDRGGTTSGTCKVGVPHSASSAAPVDDGPRSCVGQGCPALPACR